jgi:hypothetical protein
MKNQTTKKMPEDTCIREVVGGSLWTGEVFGLFIQGSKKTGCPCFSRQGKLLAALT